VLERLSKDNEVLDMVTTNNLIAAVKEVIDHKEGRLTLEATEISVPDLNVKEIRENLHLSQIKFSEVYGLPLSTVQNWEQGQRKPEGAARILLNLIARKPTVIAEEIKKMKATA
jgi:putative transcriptional regulator